MKKHPLTSFFLLTFAITWGLAGLYFLIPRRLTDLFGPISPSNPIFILAVWAPTLSGFILSAATGGKAAVAALLKRFLPGRVSVLWYLLVVVVVPAAGILISAVTRAAMPLQSASSFSFLSYLFINLITGPLGEEFGWRGFALPRLLARYKAAVAALILGLVWGLWHLPSFLVSGTWVFVHVKLSIFFGFLFHYFVNFTLSMISGALLPISLVLTAWAILIVALFGWDLGRPADLGRASSLGTVL